MAGPPRTPDEILRKRGTTGHRHRLSAVPEDVQKLSRADNGRPPKPPRTLGDAGTSLWKRLWAVGLDWISPDSDMELVLTVCELCDEMTTLRTSIMSAEIAVPGVLGQQQKRTYDTLRDMRAQYINGLSRLGLSPTDRARLSVGEVAPADPLAEFREATG